MTHQSAFWSHTRPFLHRPQLHMVEHRIGSLGNHKGDGDESVTKQKIS